MTSCLRKGVFLLISKSLNRNKRTVFVPNNRLYELTKGWPKRKKRNIISHYKL
jgi:hypothetical protein